MLTRMRWLLTIPSHTDDERRRADTLSLITWALILTALLLFPLGLTASSFAGQMVLPSAILGFVTALLVARFVHMSVGASVLIAVLLLGVFSSMLLAREPSFGLFYLPLSVLIATLTLHPRQIWLVLLANLLGIAVLCWVLPPIVWTVAGNQDMVIGSLVLLGTVTVISFLGAKTLTTTLDQLEETRSTLERTAIALAHSNLDLEAQVTVRTAELRQALAIQAEQAQALQLSLDDRQRAEQALIQERASLAQRVEERTAELSAANAALARAVRLKDEFLTTMSHELRTPLSAVLGMAQLLQQGVYGPLAPNHQRPLQQIEASGKHLLDLITDILDLAKVAAGRLDLTCSAVAVAALCQRSLEVLTPLAHKKRIAVSLRLDPAVPMIRGDERRLTQILVNLLSNAVKFTPDAGQVGLEVSGDRTQQVVRLTVWDSGVGIAEEDLPKLFKPFVQLDSRLARHYEGTGLGLALVARMVELHGGGISVTSTLGQGSRFTVALPWCEAFNDGQTVEESTPQCSQALSAAGSLATSITQQQLQAALHTPVPPAPAAHMPTLADEPVQPPARRPLVLLAEDNEATINVLSDALRYHRYQVVIARTGHEAIARAQERKPDAIVMDIQMPELDGLAAIGQIRADVALAHIPIIALTALAMPGDRERCLAMGANAYLSKPVNYSGPSCQDTDLGQNQWIALLSHAGNP
jgi:signal transduction histidine kinase